MTIPNDITGYTLAKLIKPGAQTPLLARFSTVATNAARRTPSATCAALR